MDFRGGNSERRDSNLKLLPVASVIDWAESIRQLVRDAFELY